MYAEASLLGISYDEYWEMDPIDVQNIAKAKHKKLMEDINYQLSMAWYSASLQGIAMNSPKKFPKKPPRIENTQDKVNKNMELAYKLKSMCKHLD